MSLDNLDLVEKVFHTICPTCNGHGEVIFTISSLPQRLHIKSETKTCPTCNGTGTVMICDWCENIATNNIQKLWMRFNILYGNIYSIDNSTMIDDQDPTGDENLHLCDKCFKRFEEGEE